MLNENRVKLMTRMAAYEEKKGKEDIPISSYYRKDYVGLNVLITILWTTIGYGLFLGLVLIGGMDNFAGIPDDNKNDHSGAHNCRWIFCGSDCLCVPEREVFTGKNIIKRNRE